MIDVLYERGLENGADVSILGKSAISQIAPIARSSTGRGLWSPGTSVTQPKIVIKKLEEELSCKGVKVIKGANIINVDEDNKFLDIMSKGELFRIRYIHLYNCTGLHSDRIAKLFNVGKEYLLLPFKGLYWRVKKSSNISLSTNLYPVPDLNVPFLGVHFTPSAELDPTIHIGPTAIPALGRENYEKFKGIEPFMTFRNFTILANQYINNKNGFRNYARDQAFLSLRPLLMEQIKLIIPEIDINDIEKSNKVGIRAQLFNKKKNEIVDDFLYVNSGSSTHILNAISPAFTASFSLADLIIDETINIYT